MSFLVLTGAGGFFASALLATGVLKLPTSWEWPAGYVNGVVTAADGKHIVPLVPAGRVQIYDSQWHFIRGWNVDAKGGDFRVKYSSSGVIEIFTARGDHHYSFTSDGQLISSITTSQPYPSSAYGQSLVVPTSPLLWVFSSPFLSWLAVVIGLIGMAIVRKLTGRPVFQKQNDQQPLS
jgi:hypothetical protein